jgi:hypothetical protein
MLEGSFKIPQLRAAGDDRFVDIEFAFAATMASRCVFMAPTIMVKRRSGCGGRSGGSGESRPGGTRSGRPGCEREAGARR